MTVFQRKLKQWMVYALMHTTLLLLFSRIVPGRLFSFFLPRDASPMTIPSYRDLIPVNIRADKTISVSRPCFPHILLPFCPVYRMSVCYQKYRILLFE
jgi:hypothetical protein